MRSFMPQKRPQANTSRKDNIMKRVQSNIVNLAFTIMNQPAQDGKGRKVKDQGVVITQALVNGQNTGVSLRTVNGGQKSAAIQLDDAALRDLLEAVNEVLAADTK